MKKIINQAPIVRYRASVSEIFFSDSWNGSFSAESRYCIKLDLFRKQDLAPFPPRFGVGITMIAFLKLTALFLLFIIPSPSWGQGGISLPYNPCLAAGVKKSVVFIGRFELPRAPDDKPRRVYFGTGFLIAIENMFHLVTAKHVIENFWASGGKDEEIFIFLNNEEGKLHTQPLAEIKSVTGAKWIFSKTADVAVIPFPLSVGSGLDAKVLSERMFLDSSQLLELQDLFFISFQPGIEGRDSLTPVIRRGMVSVVNSDGSFYMDAFAFPGNSGSPVFIRPSAGNLFTQEGVSLGADPRSCRFVGVIGAYLPYREVAISTQTKRPRVIFEENTGLALVWQAEVLRELAKTQEFKEQQNALLKKFPKSKK